MARYRRKPTEVEATQWFPGVVIPGLEEITDNPRILLDGSTIPCWAEVTTIHGQKTVVIPGDWVLTEPDGIHLYPCKPAIFAATYDAV
jgi:hypothetical protein